MLIYWLYRAGRWYKRHYLLPPRITTAIALGASLHLL